MIELKGRKVLFDPFVRGNPMASGIDITNLRPDYILITHGHVDHIADAVEIAKQSGALVISNFEIIEWIQSQGVKNTHPMNIG
ncbi:MAG: MBL fold metallo-hydrolase, partial [Methylophilaceae bacterium]